jgi:hypothetical protein
MERSTNLPQFNRQLLRTVKKIEGDEVKFFKTVAFEAFRRIVMRTPVDSGRCRGNWQIGINEIITGTIDNRELWNNVFLRESVKLDELKELINDSVVHITNNVDYCYYLEYERRSRQAPGGFVEITLEELRTFLAGIK